MPFYFEITACTKGLCHELEHILSLYLYINMTETSSVLCDIYLKASEIVFASYTYPWYDNFFNFNSKSHQAQIQLYIYLKNMQQVRNPTIQKKVIYRPHERMIICVN